MGMCVRAWAPGRIELAGNHTDHQGGRSIAATVDCGIEMRVEANGMDCAHIQSEGFEPVSIDVADAEPHADEVASTAALVRGVVSGLCGAGIQMGGFDARVRSTIPVGAGLSSSAAFELALGQALNKLFADGRVPCEELAVIGQTAEREYFGKPCGLMDQLAIARGGIVSFDFGQAVGASDGREGALVHTESLQFDFEAAGFALCLVDAHCDHSRYTDEYAQVADDMCHVAAFFGASVLSQVPEGSFMERLGDVRRALGDLPALRALHYYHEMHLVDERAHALKSGDMGAFLTATRRSGSSSAQYLQNVSTFDRYEQPAMVALALVDVLLEGEGACRIHGGGFGGSIQAFVPVERLEAFVQAVDAQLGAGSCKRYAIVGEGAQAR